ncbi:hypothetical protein ACOACO_17185 [Nocardioides sp. CPCC 205120]|uniref:hypothetical protein n=1 Tax=Nocardioides sp. CPCC 205120 TaxID=3406462 RepID=UPI003B514069
MPRPSAPAEPRPSRRQVGLTVAGVALVAVVLLLDLNEGFAERRTVGIVLAIVGAGLVAGVIYSFWGAAPVRTIRMHAALLAAMVGGATVTAAATSAAEDDATTVFANEVLGAIGLAGLAVAVAGLLAQARAAGAPPTPGAPARGRGTTR